MSFYVDVFFCPVLVKTNLSYIRTRKYTCMHIFFYFLPSFPRVVNLLFFTSSLFLPCIVFYFILSFFRSLLCHLERARRLHEGTGRVIKWCLSCLVSHETMSACLFYVCILMHSWNTRHAHIYIRTPQYECPVIRVIYCTDWDSYGFLSWSTIIYPHYKHTYHLIFNVIQLIKPVHLFLWHCLFFFIIVIFL